MKIITGKTGSTHVSAEHDRAKHAGTYGTGDYVLNVGSKFAAKVTPSNTIEIADGDGMMQGTHFRIPHGDYDDVIIDNGSSGYIRKDLIVARYKRSGDIEDVQLAVIKGEPSASDPQVPTCTKGDILSGAALAEMPLYEVTVDCTVAEEVKITVSEPLFTVITGIDDVYRKKEVYRKNEVYKEQGLFDAIYPVGAIYMSVNNVNPSTLFGGTWVAWGSGRVPVGVNASDNNFNTVEKTGGASTVTLTAQQIPPHSHGVNNFLTLQGATGTKLETSSTNVGVASGSATEGLLSNTGGGQAHSNLQPYITCYMWKRTA